MIGSITAPMLISSLTEVLSAQPTAVRQPLIWLRGQSSGIHENTIWSTPGFFSFIRNHFQVLSSDIVDQADIKTQLPDYAPSPVLILDGYFTQDTETSLFQQLKYLVSSSRAIILFGNEAAYSSKHPEGFLDIEARFIYHFEKPLIKLPGNPTPARYLLGTLNHLILYNRLPDLDEFRRPMMFYSTTVCDRCEYRGDFETGNFVRYFGEKEGCLYHLGCKGPITKNSCPTNKFNNSHSWCVGVGSPCTGCSEPDYDSHTGLGLYGVLSPDRTGINSYFIRNSGTIAKGVLGLTAIGIGLHAVSKKASPPMEIQTELFNGEEIDE